MNQNFIIEGGYPLSGEITPSGNKNEALPVICATILGDAPITLKNVPKIGDVLTLCDILSSLGAKVHWQNEIDLVVDPTTINRTDPPTKECEKIRASILLLGPLLAKFGKVSLPLPGGDVIGKRRIDTHWEGFQTLGATLTFSNKIEASAKKLKGCDLFLDEPSVSGTENLIMSATLAEGETVIHNAACEPHVVGLCEMLNSMGAKIEGIGSNILRIKGVKSLGGCTHEIGPDFMEVGSYLCLGAISGGKVKINNIRPRDLRFILKTLTRLGIQPDVFENYLNVKIDPPHLKVKKDLGGTIPTIYSGPWPAFPTDLMSVAIVAATQSQGTVIFFEKMFEGRMFFTDQLLRMGANIVLCDPHRIVVNGRSDLFATNMSSPDVRAGMSLVMAALIAKGTSRISNIYQIERGYSQVEEKLRSLGAKIWKES